MSGFQILISISTTSLGDSLLAFFTVLKWSEAFKRSKTIIKMQHVPNDQQPIPYKWMI